MNNTEMLEKCLEMLRECREMLEEENQTQTVTETPAPDADDCYYGAMYDRIYSKRDNAAVLNMAKYMPDWMKPNPISTANAINRCHGVFKK